MQPYPLASSYFGVEHAAVLDHPCIATTLGVPQLADAPVSLLTTLLPDHRTGGWRVNSPLGFIGWMTREEAEEFPQLSILRKKGFMPTAPATIEMVDGWVEVAVTLGLSCWQVPKNDAASPVLLGGSGQLIDTAASSDVTAADIASLGTCQFFVELRPAGNRKDAGEDEGHGATVLALADGRVIGAITSSTLARLCAAHGPLSARAYAAGGLVAVDLPPLGPDLVSGPESALAAASAPTQTVPPLGLNQGGLFRNTAAQREAKLKAATSPEWDFTAEGPVTGPQPTGSRRGLGPEHVTYTTPEDLPGAPTQTFRAMDFPTGMFESPGEAESRLTPSGPAPTARRTDRPGHSAPVAKEDMVSVADLASELYKQESMTREFRALSSDFRSESQRASTPGTGLGLGAENGPDPRDGSGAPGEFASHRAQARARRLSRRGKHGHHRR